MNEYVLIVEDDSDSREILSKMIGIQGWKTQVAPDGQIALSMIDERLPLLILLDLVIPKVSGFKIISKLKSNNNTRDIPIIVISGFGADERLEKLGVNHILPKGNFTIANLRKLLSQYLVSEEIIH